jgi:tetratricopeptide (TPR) repeat protein
MLGRALMTLGKEEKAAYHINKADTLQDIGYDIAMYKLNTKTFPGDVDRWIELGDAYRSVGRYKEAMDTFRIAENLQPSNLNILNRMANVSYEMENPGQAIRLYRRILELKPDEPKIWYNLGMAYMMEGNLDRGRWAFEKALHYDPDFDPAKVYLSRL